MIIDTLDNLHKYASVFKAIKQVKHALNDRSLNDVSEKISSGDIILIPLLSEGVSDNFDESILESHQTLMDIHITLAGVDVIAFADLENETTLHKAYDENNDYALSTSDKLKTLSVPQGYFCIIPNNFAHMALYKGHSDVKKIVVKMPVNS